MILLLGASGYVGQAFSRELRRRGRSFIPLTRKAIDYTNFDLLFDYVRKIKPEFMINAAGFTGNPNVDACELAREETLSANTLLPQTLARICLMTNTPWGHVSSACIYSGAKVLENGRMVIEKNLNQPKMRLLLKEHPEKICGYTEWDQPNFSFRNTPCNFYSGAKALAEESIRGVGQNYIWRPGMPFNEWEESRNLLWRLQRYPKIYDGVNSISHLDDFAKASLDLREQHAAFGIYNITNPGAVTTRQVAKMIQEILKPNRQFEYWKDDEEFYRLGAKAPRSNSILDVSKLRMAGVKMRPVLEALEDSLRHWQPAKPVAEPAREMRSEQNPRLLGRS